MNYYNEFDPYAAEWLRNLIAAGHIPAGHVDERSIADVRPEDLEGFDQCHFFAGIGGWPLALRRAGWPDDRPVWTGSCPCQPFSAAGKGEGFGDERHLWPVWFGLISERRPPVCFGEQVASPAGLAWLDAVSADMEGAGYAIGAADLCSAGVGAPHIRQRLGFVADRVVNGLQQGLEGYGGHGDHGNEPGRLDADQAGSVAKAGATGPAGPVNGFWRDADWLHGRDGKWRPVEPGTFPLAHGVSARVGRLRAYGNAINPWQFAEFIKAYMEVRG